MSEASDPTGELWGALRGWMESDPDGRKLLGRFAAERGVDGLALAGWVNGVRDRAPAEFHTEVSGGRIDRLIQIASAGVVNLSLGEQSLPAADLRNLYRGVFERHALFGGRERELASLDDALGVVRAQVAAGPAEASSEGGVASGRYLFVSAPAGFGKSALLATWLRRLEGRAADASYAFINRLAGTADEATTLRALCQQLLPEPERTRRLPGEAGDLRARFRELVASAPAGEPSVVVIDGLDEAGWQMSGLLPGAPPAGRLIVLSARATGADWIGELGVDRAVVTTIALDTLGTGEIAELLLAAGGSAARLAGDAAFVGKLHEVSVYEGRPEHPGGDPLYVRLLVEDVREGRIASVADLARQPGGLRKYFDRWWTEITEALAGPALRDLLGYLLVAKGPIGRGDLVAISADDALDEWGDGDKAPPIEDVLARVDRFLIGGDTGWALGHPRFEAYLRERRFDEQLIGTYAARLHGYCARWAERRPPSPYALAHYPEHLRELGRAPALVDLLTDPRFMAAKAEALGIDALLGDHRLVEGLDAGPDEPGWSALAAVGQALRRSRMALARDPGELAAQLYGRLLGRDAPRLRQLLAELAGIAPRCWLAARTTAMASEADLDATLTLSGTVRALAFGALGQSTVLAIGIDDRICLQDPQRGSSEQRPLENDGARVTGLALGTLEARPVLVVAAGYDGRLVVRDAISGDQVGPIVSLPSYVDSVALGSMDDRVVIAAAGNGQVWAWGAGSDEPATIATDGLPGRVAGVTTVDGRLALTVVGLREGATPSLLVVDATSGDAVRPGVVRGIAREPTGVATAEVRGGVVLGLLWHPALIGLWSAETGDSVGPYIDVGDAPVRCLAVAEVAGRSLVAASLDYEGTGVILLREAGGRDPATRTRPIGPHDRPIHALRADAQGRVTALIGPGLTVKETLVEGDDPLVARDDSPDEETVAEMLTGTTSPAGFTVELSGPGGRGVRLIGEGDIGARATGDAERFQRSAPAGWRATARCWAALGERAVLAIGSYAGVVWLWDIGDRSLLAGPFADIPEEVVVARPEVKAARPPEVTGVAVGRAGGRDVVATACAGRLRVWDARSGQRLPAPDTGDQFVTTLALGPLGGRDALVSGSRGGVLCLWDAASAERLAGVTLDAGVEGAWIVRGADMVAALTGDSQLHVFDVRPGGGVAAAATATGPPEARSRT